MEVDSPPATRLEARWEKGDQDSPYRITHRAIQTIEIALRGKGLLELVEDAWERVKKAALEGIEAQGRQDASGLSA